MNITGAYMASLRKPVMVIMKKVRPKVYSINNDPGIFT